MSIVSCHLQPVYVSGSFSTSLGKYRVFLGWLGVEIVSPCGGGGGLVKKRVNYIEGIRTGLLTSSST